MIKFQEENQIELFPNDSFYNTLLSSSNKEVIQSEDITEVQCMLFNWQENNKKYSYNFSRENIDGSIMIIIQTDTQKEMLKK